MTIRGEIQVMYSNALSPVCCTCYDHTGWNTGDGIPMPCLQYVVHAMTIRGEIQVMVFQCLVSSILHMLWPYGVKYRWWYSNAWSPVCCTCYDHKGWNTGDGIPMPGLQYVVHAMTIRGEIQVMVFQCLVSSMLYMLWSKITYHMILF